MITINAANLSTDGTDAVLDGDGYTLALASDVDAPQTAEPYFSDIVDGTTTYKSVSNTEGWTLSQNSDAIVHTSAVAPADMFTLSGIASTAGITVDEDNVITLKASNLSGADVTLEDELYTLALADDVAAPEFFNAYFTAVENGSATYKSASNSSGYELSSDGKTIDYIEVSSDTDLFTLTGITGTDGITVDATNHVITFAADSLGDSNVTIGGIESNVYVFALASDVAAPDYTGAYFTAIENGATTYRSASNSEGYEVSGDGKTIDHRSWTAGTDLFTLTGIVDTDGITLDTTNHVITLGTDNLGNADVSITGLESDVYTLALASGINAPEATAAGFTDLADGTATYMAESNTGGYTLSDDGKSIEYTATVEPRELFTLSGLVSTAGITISASNAVILHAGNLGSDTSVSLTGTGYVLAPASGIDTPTATAAHFTDVATGTTTYKSASTTAGYALADDGLSVSYTAAVDETELFTLSGVSSTE